jgi:type I restriction enzyme S subunit
MIPGLKPYPAYRDSGVEWLGEVPERWEVLPALAAYKPKLVKNTGMSETTVLSLSYGRIIVKPQEKLHGLVPESYETHQIVDPGDIVVRTTDLQNDHTSLRVGHSEHRGIITAAYMCLQTRDQMTNGFGYLLLSAYELTKIIYGFGSGLRQSIDFGHIKRMPVLVPPPDEQSAIVHFLDHVDRRIRRYIRSKQRLIALLHEQRQAIIHRAVTRGLEPNVRLKPSGVECLGDIPDHWEAGAFTRCTVEKADYRGATPTKTESGVFLVTARNIRKGWIDYETSKEFVSPDEYSSIMRRGLPRRGDLLLTTEAPLGNAALVDREDVALAQRVIRFRLDPERLLPEFALRSVLAPYFQHQLLCRGTGSTALGIKASKLPQLQVLCPPIAEQRRILSWLDAECSPPERIAEKASTGISLLREYRTRLISDVVTGKLDVREAAAHLPEETGESEPLDDTDTSPEDISEETEAPDPDALEEAEA